MKERYLILVSLVVVFAMSGCAGVGRPGLGSVAQLEPGTVICRFVPDLQAYRNASLQNNSFAMQQMVNADTCRVLNTKELCTVTNYGRGRTTAVTLHSNGKLVVVDSNSVKSTQ